VRNYAGLPGLLDGITDWPRWARQEEKRDSAKYSDAIQINSRCPLFLLFLPRGLHRQALFAQR